MNRTSEKIVHLEKRSLKRVLGAGDLFAVGYGDVGSSIYYALGLTALYALGATPIALALAGFVFICTALTYAEMSSTYPESGGTATYARHAFNDLISFIAGWGLLLDYILTIAISAFAIPPYVKYIFDLFTIPYPTSVLFQTTATVGIIAFLFVLNVIGVKQSGRFSKILALITILSQAFLVLGAGIVLLNLPYIFDHMRIGVQGVDWSPNWTEFIKGVAMAMVAYTGIESIAQLAAETSKPAATVPKAIKWTITTLILLYFGISMVGLSVVSPQELGTTYINDPIAGIVANLPFGGTWLAPWFGLIAAIILLIASNAGLLGCSRLIFSMGEFYQVPRFFYQLLPRFRTPYIALAVFALLASGVVILSRGKLLFLADLYNFGAQIAFFFAHLSLIVLRIKKPDLKRPFRAPFNIPIGKKRTIPLTSVIGLLGTFMVWVIVVITKPEGRNLGFTWLAVGIAMYLFYRRKTKIAPLGHLEIEKIKIPQYHPMKLKNILVAARSIDGTEAIQTACELAKSNHSKVTAVYILEIHESLPLHASMPVKEHMGMIALKRAEAIAREYHLTIELKLIRARSTAHALLDMAREEHFDMVVIGTMKDEWQRQGFATQTEKVLKRATCRVLFCKS